MNPLENLIKKYVMIRREHDKLEERLKKSRLEKVELIKQEQKTEEHLKAI